MKFKAILFSAIKGVRRLVVYLSTCFCIFITCQLSAQQTQLNPKFVYFYNGQATPAWSLTLGDSGDWTSAIKQLKGTSSDGQIEAKPAVYSRENDAIHLSWSRRKGKGQFAIYGNGVDLSEIEHRAALTMEVKVIKKPKKSVTLGMDCGYPCRAEIHVHKMFRSLPKGEWVTFPVPLNCFTAKGLDPKKINGPLVLASDGRFEIQLANIRMELLPEGAPTCQ